MSKYKKTLIVVPIYGQWHLVSQFVHSLCRTTQEHEFALYFIVNKHPHDDEESVYAKLRECDKILNDTFNDFILDVQLNDVNLGVAKSWNQGIEYFVEHDDKYDSICFANSDIILGTEWLTWMRFVMDNTPDVFCVQTMLTEGEYQEQEFNLCNASILKPDNPVRRAALGLNGCLFMLTHACIQKVGKFDEQFEIGFWEDADYLMRLREAHNPPVVAGRAYAHHICGASREDMGESFNHYADANRKRFNAKWNLDLEVSLDTKCFPEMEDLKRLSGE